MKEKEKFEKLIDALGITIYQFGKDLGFARVEPIYKILRGDTKDPSASIYGKIKKAYPEVNLDWLVTGEGSMFIEKKPSANIELIEKVNTLETEYKVLQGMYERAILKQIANSKELEKSFKRGAINSPGNRTGSRVFEAKNTIAKVRKRASYPMPARVLNVSRV